MKNKMFNNNIVTTQSHVLLSLSYLSENLKFLILCGNVTKKNRDNNTLTAINARTFVRPHQLYRNANTRYSIDIMIVLKIFVSFCIILHFCDGYSVGQVFEREFVRNNSINSVHTDIVTYSNFVFAIAFPFSFEDRQFFYQNVLVPNDLNRRKWSIKELLADGNVGAETDSGSWTEAYDVSFPFEIDGKQFIYAQNLNDRSWIIQELLLGGKMGTQTAKGSWLNVYESVFPFSIDGRHFFYGKNVHSGHWFIQELLAGGKMGAETDHGDTSVHEGTYEATFAFAIDGRHYFYRQNLKNDHEWFIQELLADGKMGKETDHGHWIKSYDVVFPFTIDGKHFFYGQSLYNHNWFIQELLAGGKMGKETEIGAYDTKYEFAVPFSFNDTQYFYGQNINSRHWFVQKLLPDGKMGEETANGDWNKL